MAQHPLPMCDAPGSVVLRHRYHANVWFLICCLAVNFGGDGSGGGCDARPIVERIRFR